MIIQHNMMAMFGARQLGITTTNKSKIAERLSSGYRINRAADDAAGLSISEKIRGQIRGLHRASANVQDGISFCNVAEGALQEVQNVLHRIRELSVQAANDTNVSADRMAINEEITQLRKEINNIARNTEFNTYKIFCEEFAVELSEGAEVVKIFDANDGDPTSPEAYGGIIVGEDVRVAWKDIDENMIYTDSDTGEIKFNAGVYTCSVGGYNLEIECEDGTKPPQIKVAFPLTATDTGIQIVGETVAWSEVKNEQGESILTAYNKEGFFSFPYGKGEGGFYIRGCQSMQDVIDGINTYNTQNERKYMNVYSGYEREQAVDMTDTGSNMRVSNDIVDALKAKKNLDAHMRADDDGIWLEDMAGNEVSGSKKTWAELGIEKWDAEDFISDENTYSYEYKDADYDIKFNFKLLDETSKESVIDGINNASIVDTSVDTNNETVLNCTTSNTVLSGKIAYSNNELSVYEEAALGRDFDIEAAALAEEQLLYDADTNKFHVTYDAVDTGVPELEYVSTGITGVGALEKDGELYQKYLAARETQALLTGDAVSYPGLNDIIGTANVTDEKYMSETVVIDSSTMKVTSNIVDGRTYPAAHMDFSGLGMDYDLYDLLGTGFNSTCKTCDNHYSLMFVYGGTTQTSSDGIGYTKTTSGGGDYVLEVDIKSMVDKGITNGADFANALVDVLDDSQFDFHFTQYAAQGSTLYVCDNRAQSSGTTDATFDTEPFSVGKSNIVINMREEGSTRTVRLSYEYDISSAVNVRATMEESATGEFVEDTDGTGYKKYVESDYKNADGTWIGGQPPKRYTVKTTATANLDEAYYDSILSDIANQSTIALNSTGFDYVKYRANENYNEATVSTFDFEIEEEKDFWIQAGANTWQGLNLEWEKFSTYSLGIATKDVMSYESAGDFITAADKALEKISKIRSDFGAYTNRMEHAYALDTNTEENLQSAESRIRDADMAEEVTRLVKEEILQQAGVAMLAQANQSTGSIVQLLQ